MVSLDHGKIHDYLSLPLAIVDTSMGVGVGSSIGDRGDGSHLGVGEPSNLGQTVSVVNMGDGTSGSLASQDLILSVVMYECVLEC